MQRELLTSPAAAAIAGLVLLMPIASSAAARVSASPQDPTLSAAKSDWVRRIEAPAVDLASPGADRSAPAPIKRAKGALTPQVVEADIQFVGTGVEYAALVVDWDGADNIFIKVQDSTGDGLADGVFFYHGNNVGAWPGVTGGSAAIALTAPQVFSSGHIRVSHDGAGNVNVLLTGLNGGTPTISITRGGWVPLDGVGTGIGSFAGDARIDDFDVFYSSDGTVCDTFDRADGALGGDWVTTNGSAFVMGNAAAGTGTAMAVYVGDCQGGIQTVEADISVIGTDLAYSALVLNSDGQDHLYIKVQHQDGSGQFTNVGFYHDSGADFGAWAGMTGGLSFFAFDPADAFSSAHMKVALYPSGVVRLMITDRDTGGGLLEFQRGGWVVRSGNDAGVGGRDTNAFIDNFSINGVPICDDFNRANGVLGPNWITNSGVNVIDGNRFRADSDTNSRSIFVGTCQGPCPSDINGDGQVNVTDLLRLLADWGGCP